MIQISSLHFQQLSTHVEACYPEEGCGLLMGSKECDRKIVTEVIPTENVWTPDFLPSINASEPKKALNLSKHNRFAIDPRFILHVQKDIRDRNIDIIGIFHSHPDGLSKPSAFDRAIAWQDYSYLILSVHQAKVQDIGSWILDDKGEFQSEKILNPNKTP